MVAPRFEGLAVSFVRCMFLIVVASVIVGCGEDSQSPPTEGEVEIDRKLLNDSWELVAMIDHGELYLQSPSGVFWLFSAAAEFCSMELGWWDYNPVECGQVETGNLIRSIRIDIETEWHLRLSAADDTLFADLNIPEHWGPLTYILVRSESPVEASCNCAPN